MPNRTGPPSTWQNSYDKSEFCTIRIPKAMQAAVINLCRLMDAGYSVRLEDRPVIQFRRYDNPPDVNLLELSGIVHLIDLTGAARFSYQLSEIHEQFTYHDLRVKPDPRNVFPLAACSGIAVKIMEIAADGQPCCVVTFRNGDDLHTGAILRETLDILRMTYFVACTHLRKTTEGPDLYWPDPTLSDLLFKGER